MDKIASCAHHKIYRGHERRWKRKSYHDSRNLFSLTAWLSHHLMRGGTRSLMREGVHGGDGRGEKDKIMANGRQQSISVFRKGSETVLSRLFVTDKKYESVKKAQCGLWERFGDEWGTKVDRHELPWEPNLGAFFQAPSKQTQLVGTLERAVQGRSTGAMAAQSKLHERIVDALRAKRTQRECKEDQPGNA